MTNDEAVLSPEEAARRWTYSDDGAHAHRALDDVTLTLHGQRDAEPKSSDKWLPTLLFAMSDDRFAFEFEIEAEQHPMPYVAWRINYSTMKVAVDGNALVPVSTLDNQIFDSWPHGEKTLVSGFGI